MLTFGALQFIVFLMVGLAASISGILLAMHKFNIFRILGFRVVCDFCIIFWTSLIISILLMWNTEVWMASVVAFGSASIGRSLLTSA